jgi:hypothetical protein
MMPPPTPVPSVIKNHVLEASAAPEAELAPGGRVGIVLHRDSQAGSATYLLVQADVLYFVEVGREDDLVLRGQNQARDGYAYSAHLETVFHLRDGPGDGLDEPVGRNGLGRVPRLIQDLAFRSNHRSGDLCPADAYSYSVHSLPPHSLNLEIHPWVQPAPTGGSVLSWSPHLRRRALTASNRGSIVGLL